MKVERTGLSAGLFNIITVLLIGFASTLEAQSSPGVPIVLRPTMRDVSPPLRTVHPLRATHQPERIPLRIPFRRSGTATADPILQTSSTATTSTGSGFNFEGVGAGFKGPQGTYVGGVVPSDSNLSVGDTQVVQWVNLEFAIFDKNTGAVLYGPAPGNTIWQGSGSICSLTNDGDPIVLYDKAAKRWIFAQLSYTLGPPYYQCVAISNTSDATGTYTRYVYQAPNNGVALPDYPKFGVWSDGYYLTWNLFQNASAYIGPAACALDRTAMLAASAQPALVCYLPGTNYASLLPADVDGAAAPASGSPGLFVSLGNDNASLFLWRMHADFGTPANSTLTGPITIPVAAYTPACNASATNTCIPQPNTSQQLDSLGDRLMYRLAYRNFGDHESLVASHSVDTGNGNVGERWYELRNPFGTPSVYQQSTYAPDSTYRWMGSVAMDKLGNIALGYNVGSSGMYPSVSYTGRLAGDSLSTMEGETPIIGGTGSQTLNRWGDYTSMSIDPSDDCTFWYTGEYLSSSGNAWKTRIGSFSFTGCIPPPVGDFSIAASPSSQLIYPGGTASYNVTVTASGGFNNTVVLSVSGLPAGTTATFSPSAVTGSGSSVLKVATTSSTPTGSFTLTVSGSTNSGLQHSQTVTLNRAGVSLSSTLLNFGSVVLGNKSVLGLALTNVSTTGLVMGSVIATGDYSVSASSCTGTIAAGARCIINVLFYPTATGTRTGTLTINDSDISSPQLVTLTGIGTGAKVSPTSIAFGVYILGTTSPPSTVTLTNVGSTPFNIQGTSLTGPNPTDFAAAPAVTNGCGTSLAAGASCSYSVTFTPTAINNRVAYFNISDDWGTQSVTLSGAGTVMQVTPTSLAFGFVALGTSAQKTVTVTNVSSSLTVTFSSITVSTFYTGQFTVSGCGGSLPPGGSCIVTVTFSPTSTGNKAATLYLYDNGGASPQRVSITGTGQ